MVPTMKDYWNKTNIDSYQTDQVDLITSLPDYILFD